MTILEELCNPRLELWRGAEQIVLNDNWWDAPDAAILATLPPGAYSAVVRGTGAAQGIGLVEIYLLP
ncbi:MAG: hypothetical protein HZC55_13375 [Verrucomicrobia bacterium]|nr:hypothetical protein [Verrucomicrobiota bacterium]